MTQPLYASKVRPDPNTVRRNLHKRFPNATERDVEAALASCDGHAGRAAKALAREADARNALANPVLSDAKIRMAFHLFDADDSGSISFREFKVAVEALGFLAAEVSFS